MMRLISNGEPYVYTHRCMGSENRGDIMTMEGVHRFLVETLYESFLHCGSNIKKMDDSWKYRSEGKTGIFQGMFSSLKQQPDLIYRMDGDSHDTWFYVMPCRVGCSKFKYKSDTKSARIQLVKLLIFNTLYCQIVL